MKYFLKHLLRKLGFEIRRVDTPMRTLERGIAVLSRYIAPASVIDVGVATGTPELYRSFPASKSGYLLIEANPAFLSDVERLAKELSAQYRMVFCGEREGSTSFTQYKNQGLSSAYQVASEREEADTISVPVRTLDALVAETELKPPFLVKIDVEGAELDVFKGAQTILANTEAVIVETSVGKRRVEAPEFADVVSFMREQGFSVFDILSGSNWQGKLSLVDVIFVRKEALFRNYD